MAERPPLEAVVFDVGGTLVRLDFEWISEMLAGLGLDVPPAALRRAEVHGRREFDAAVAARAASHDGVPVALPANEVYWGGMLAHAGCPGALVAEALARMQARQVSDDFLWARPVDGARETLAELVGSGVRVACVSNSDGRAAAHLERFGLLAPLEFVIDSGRVGLEKPDPGIFHLALGRMGVPAGRALYVGDLLSVDEAGARAAGMRFVLIDPFGDYAPPGVAGIAALRELSASVAGTYTIPARASGRDITTAT